MNTCCLRLAVPPERRRPLAHAQNNLIWTAVGITEVDPAAAPNGGGVRVLRDRRSLTVIPPSTWRDTERRLVRCVTGLLAPPANVRSMMRENVPVGGGQILPRLGMRCMRWPGGETKIQLLRMPEPDRREFIAVHNRKAPEAIRMFVDWSLPAQGPSFPNGRRLRED
jgi:hypothetical protein